MRKRWRNIGIATAVLLIGGLLLAGPVQAWRDARNAWAAFRDGEIEQRQGLLRYLARLRTTWADAILREALADPDPRMRDYAAYAISSTRYREMAGDVLAAWQRETDVPARSKMIMHWAIVADGSCEPILREMVGSDDPWTALGAARGLLWRGHLDAAGTLLAMAAAAGEGNTALRRHEAQHDLQLLAGPIGDITGQPSGITDFRPGEWPADRAAAFVDWWREHVTPRLLKDYLAWRNDKPEDWRKAMHLVTSWRAKCGGFLNMSKSARDSSLPRQSP